MSIFEYDQEKHIQQERDASREEGRQEERIKAIENMISLGLTKEKILTKYSEEKYSEVWGKRTFRNCRFCRSGGCHFCR